MVAVQPIARNRRRPHGPGERLRTAIGGWLHRLGDLLEQAGDVFAGKEREHERADPQRWKLRKLAKLDRTRSFVAAKGARVLAVKSITIPSRGVITAAITVHAPPGLRRGTQRRLDILQRANGKIVGGSTYVIALI